MNLFDLINQIAGNDEYENLVLKEVELGEYFCPIMRNMTKQDSSVEGLDYEYVHQKGCDAYGFSGEIAFPFFEDGREWVVIFEFNC